MEPFDNLAGRYSHAGPRLALSLPPRPDEVFTSWVVRLAAAQGLATGTFCNLIAGGKTEFNRDMDGPTCERLLLPLASRTGFCADRLRQEHTFGGFGGRLFAEAHTTTANRWVLPVGTVVNRKPALQFCPACLAGDKIPYFRRAWRLSLFVTCPVHATRLRHLCPRCNHVVSPMRGHLRHGLGTTPLCWHCRFDLRCVPAEPVTDRDAGFARDCYRALYEGISPIGGSPGIEPRDFLATLAIVCTRLTGDRPRLCSWREMVAASADAPLPPPIPNAGISAFDSLSDPACRLPILRAAAWLLESWPERFLEVARTAKTRTSDFCPNFAATPAWFLEPLRLRLTPIHHAPPPTKGIVRAQSMRELILAKRTAWCLNRQGRIVRALRAAGYYSALTDDRIILRALRRTIAKLRIENRNYRLHATRQVARGTAQWKRLCHLAKPFRKGRCAAAEQLQQGICLLCQSSFLSVHDLSELLGRSRLVLKATHLTPMVRAGLLETRFGPNATGRCNHPCQAYHSTIHAALTP